MAPSDDFGVILQVRALQRARAIYERLGFVGPDGAEDGRCRLRRGTASLTLTAQVRDDADPGRPAATRGSRGYGVVLRVVVRDFDDVLAYWLEEGMLVVDDVGRDRAGRFFHGVDPDGHHLRIEEPGG